MPVPGRERDTAGAFRDAPERLCSLRCAACSPLLRTTQERLGALTNAMTKLGSARRHVYTPLRSGPAPLPFDAQDPAEQGSTRCAACRAMPRHRPWACATMVATCLVD